MPTVLVRVVSSLLFLSPLTHLRTRSCGCIAGFWTAGDAASRERCASKAATNAVINADIINVAGAAGLQALSSLDDEALETIVKERGLTASQVAQAQALGSMSDGMLRTLVGNGGSFGLMNMAKLGAAGGAGGGMVPKTTDARRLLAQGLDKVDKLEAEGLMPPPPSRSQSAPSLRPGNDNPLPLPKPFTGRPRGRSASREGSERHPTKGKLLARQAQGLAPANAPPRTANEPRAPDPSPRNSRVDLDADDAPLMSSLQATWGGEFNASEVSTRSRISRNRFNAPPD